MTLESMHERAQRLHHQLRTFALPAGIRADIRFELEALELAIAEIERRSRDASGLTPLSGGTEDGNATVERPSLQEMLAQLKQAEPLMPVVSLEDLDRFEKNALTGDKDLERRNQSLIKKLRELGQFRDLRKVPSDWLKRLARLEQRFPNFREPIEYLRACLYAGSRKDGSVHFAPMLLDGPPGVGKTMFCEELADAFRLPYARLDMASAQSSSMLAGSDVYWTNTRPGRVCSEILLGKVASPLFVLDELDKATGDDRYPVVNALYPLLEPRTAQKFEDLSLPDLAFDASRALWIATSNDLHRLDAPVLDRMRPFSIEPPSASQMRRMVECTLDSVLRGLRLTRKDVNLGATALSRLSQLPPRLMKRTVEECVARAALRRQRSLCVPTNAGVGRRPKIGFA